MKLPVSVKGVVSDGERIILLRNERDEWELPGGRLEAGEGLRECLGREILEETDLHVEIGALLDAQVYEVVPGRSVLIVTFACSVAGFDRLRSSEEHLEAGVFRLDELDGLRLPQVYRDAARLWEGMIS